jgi:NADH-ubiquinone oxidoreductase chain 5
MFFVTLSLVILLLPLLNFLICINFGRFLGHFGIKKVTLFNFLILTASSYYLYFVTAKYNFAISLNFGSWITSNILTIDWLFNFDTLTTSMLLIVTLISSLVHMYSFDYMKADPHFIRFISYLSLFTFFMLILISADNLVCMFVGWEGVGICSYLLINFWYTRIQANKAAIKAMLMNRIGDCGVLFGMLILANTFETTDITILSTLIPFFATLKIEICGTIFSIIDVVAFSFFIGTVGKSAQLGLHTWLPSAMEGPTPVSALIHAATMVTAGIFLLIRNSYILEYSSILNIIVVWGALTAIFSALLALVQHDLKKIIAYSTCSQLGYMTMACGVSNYIGSLYHLINHAFFKALLFLSAGVIIHFLNNEQDLRKMGNLKTFLPFTYSVMLIATLAITGFPFLSGFYSKDIIIENLFIGQGFASNFAFWLASVTALLTAYYSWRLVYYVFFSTTNGLRINYVFSNKVEMELFTFLPLFLLAFGSIFSGYLLNDNFTTLNNTVLSNSIFIKPSNYTLILSEFLPFYIKIIPTFFSIFGFLIFLFFQKRTNYLLVFKYKFNFIYNFLLQHGFFDLIYNNFAKYILVKSYTDIFLLIDKGLLEKIGPFSFDLYYQQFIYLFFKYFQNSITYYFIFIFYFFMIGFYLF